LEKKAKGLTGAAPGEGPERDRGFNFAGLSADNQYDMFLTVEITKADDEYKVRCSELNLEATGPTSEKALAKLKKIIDFYMVTAREGSAEAVIVADHEEPSGGPSRVH
jgi:hypothetical protein